MAGKPAVKVVEDRRIRRTKKMLRQGLAELLSEKSFRDITVKDITDRMDLSRGTFYLHYNDTADLLEKVENEITDNFETMIEDYCPADNETSFLIIKQVFDYVEENKDICKTLFLNGSAGHFLEKFERVLTVKGFELQREWFEDLDPSYTEYMFSFITHGIVGLVKKWFQEEMATPADKMVATINQVVTTLFQLMSSTKHISQ